MSVVSSVPVRCALPCISPSTTLRVNATGVGTLVRGPSSFTNGSPFEFVAVTLMLEQNMEFAAISSSDGILALGKTSQLASKPFGICTTEQGGDVAFDLVSPSSELFFVSVKSDGDRIMEIL